MTLKEDFEYMRTIMEKRIILLRQDIEGKKQELKWLEAIQRVTDEEERHFAKKVP